MKVLRSFIRVALNEAAISATSAMNKGLALFYEIDDGEEVFILYDPREAYHNLSETAAIGHESIYGSIRVSGMLDDNAPCWNAAEVKFAAARKGYGPLIYDIAMSTLAKEGKRMMSDRNSVSQAAKNIWKVYGTRQDIEKLELDDVKNPRTPQRCDDCDVYEDDGSEPLNYAYSIKTPVSMDSFVGNHHKFLDNLISDKYWSVSDIEDFLILASDEFFRFSNVIKEF